MQSCARCASLHLRNGFKHGLIGEQKVDDLLQILPPVNFPVIGTVRQAGKMNITYLDQ
ncbi:hypothetical protein BN874_1100022 [Candidatus Contendobacter odensis Run_B_J11]|uniref:Uncharacterized protein n=1 Tax=Candidatus Contendobacter odensis Run_B_J11 TaxID=1400861 RepID=A0A7U7G7I5_9GAMM|nr:hypothetical protein BN874_1100022 [Candidatus Contendobacter odensis Run_B_J11]